MSFTAQIGQLTGSATTNDGTTITQGLENAQLEVIQKVAQVQPDMLNLMSSDVTTTSNSETNNNLSDNAIVLNVKRQLSVTTNNATVPASNTYIQFDGVNDYLKLKDSSDKSALEATNVTGISISVWVKFLRNDAQEPIFFTHNDNSNYRGFSLEKSSANKIQFSWYDGSGTSSSDRRSAVSSQTVEQGIWYNIIITSTFGTSVSNATFFYINGDRGTSDITVTGEGSMSYPTWGAGDMEVGKKTVSTDAYANIQLKALTIWKHKLNSESTSPYYPVDSSVTSLYEAGAGHDPQSPIGSYDTSDVSGLSLHLDFTRGTPIVNGAIGVANTFANSDISLESGAVVISDGFNCSFTDKKFDNKLIDIDSIYYADSTNPAYTIDSGKIKIFPVPTSYETASITKVVPGAINDGSETIANMPRFLHNQVVRLASYYVLLKKIGDVRDSLPTDLDANTTAFDEIADFNDSIGVTTSLPSVPGAYSNAIDKAQALIDDVASIGGDTNTDGSGVDIYSAQKWLVDEDPEMLQSTLAVASQELQRASTALSSHNAEINKYQAEISKESAEAGQALQEYQANLTKKIQSFTTLINKLNTDYQWMTAQLGIIKNMIDEGWTSIFTPKGDSDISRMGAGK